MNLNFKFKFGDEPDELWYEVTICESGNVMVKESDGTLIFYSNVRDLVFGSDWIGLSRKNRERLKEYKHDHD